MTESNPDPVLVARLRRTMGHAAGYIDLDKHAELIARRVEQARRQARNRETYRWATDELQLALWPGNRRRVR